MKIVKLEIKEDKNNEQYVLATYQDSKGKERRKVLTHYDLEYSLKGKIKYEINKQSQK